MMGDKYPSSREVLQLLKVSGFIFASFLMPGFPKILKGQKQDKKRYRYWKDFDRRRLKQTITRLKDRGLVNEAEKAGYSIIKITKKGREEVLKYKLDEMRIKVPRKWDKKWRLVIFDIPKKKKTARDSFRRKLKELGFFILQKSVFIYPYPCRQEITFLKELFGIEPYVLFLVVNQFEKDDLVRLKFNL